MIRSEDDVLDQLTGTVEIPELGLRTDARGALAAFWAGHRAGTRGEAIPKTLDFDEPGIYRRAHAAGRKFFLDSA